MTIKKQIPIGGFHKQSLIDYPGHISAVIFTCGCNFRCDYCHNPHLLEDNGSSVSVDLNEELVLQWIRHNTKMLDAVVITGGEPTLHKSLPEFIRKIKDLGVKVKLDTNGSNPDMLQKLIEDGMLDYVAMDVKAPLSIIKYRAVVGNLFNDSLLEKVMRSVNILNQKKLECEFRTTADERFSIDDFKAIAGEISGSYYVQNRVGKDFMTLIKVDEHSITEALNSFKKVTTHFRN